jgi:hypothetical protein
LIRGFRRLPLPGPGDNRRRARDRSRLPSLALACPRGQARGDAPRRTSYLPTPDGGARAKARTQPGIDRAAAPRLQAELIEDHKNPGTIIGRKTVPPRTNGVPVHQGKASYRMRLAHHAQRHAERIRPGSPAVPTPRQGETASARVASESRPYLRC